MADIFIQSDVTDLMKDKSILFLGDSIMRNIYQDFLTLNKNGGLTSHKDLRLKGERMPSHCGDKLMNNTGKLIKGRNYKEEREFDEGGVVARFYFLTSCWSADLEKYLNRIKSRNKGTPDVIFVLSCLWDINRWGINGIDEYKKNPKKLIEFVRSNFPGVQLVWLMSPPLSVSVNGGVMIEGMDERGMRFNVLEGNLMVATIVASYGFDVVDLHYYLLHQVHKRMPDGIHWTQDAVRMQTNIILTHFCLSRKIPLPGRDKSNFVQAAKKIADKAKEGPVDFVKKKDFNVDAKRKISLDTTEPTSKKLKIDDAGKSLKESLPAGNNVNNVKLLDDPLKPHSD